MDEREFKSAYRNVNERPCTFMKALLRRCVGCARSQKVLIAEREAMACQSPGGQQRCAELLAEMKPRALFALRIEEGQPLAHGKAIKLQCGGLLGLAESLGESGVDDVHALIDRAQERYGAFEAFPYSAMMPAITHFKVRNR